MTKYLFKYLRYIAVSLVSFSCASAKKLSQSVTGKTQLKYLNTYEIPNNFQFQNTTVGGLSGIDYDASKDMYYLISDDRSEKNPARFYTAKIFISQNGIDSMLFTGIHNLLRADGTRYPNNQQDKYHVPDPEAIRYNPEANQLAWSSEGERIINSKDTVLEDPSVSFIKLNGIFIDSLILPANMHMSITEKGPRRNGVFEGLSYADDYKTLFVNVEEPLYEDGPRADVVENNAYIRIIKFDAATKKSVGQYLYKLEPVAHPAIPETAFKINGVPDILSIGRDKLLVVERSFSTGRLPCTIKLFIADLHNASDVTNKNIKDMRELLPIRKKLLLNMDELGIYTDNIEGVTFGPILPNGYKTLVFVADNNFSPSQKTQVLLFEITE